MFGPTEDIDWTRAEAAHADVPEKAAAYYEACAERGRQWSALRELGVSTRQIAQHFGISHEQVQRAIQRVNREDAA